MWVSYLLYIGFMMFNEKILSRFPPPVSDSYKVTPEDEAAADATRSLSARTPPTGVDVDKEASAAIPLTTAQRRASSILIILMSCRLDSLDYSVLVLIVLLVRIACTALSSV